MPLALYAHLLPALVAPEDLAGGAVVAVDVLRATTSIAYALEAGALGVLPFLTVEAAVEERDRRVSGGEACLLGGERGGVGIPGFELTNSPGDYTPSRVGGKWIAFTTTNGTKAVQHAAAAKKIYAGSFACGSALVDLLWEDALAGLPIHLLCAGTNGRITREDVLFAGWLAARLYARDQSWEYNDDLLLALGAAKSYAAVNSTVQPGTDDQSLARALRLTQGGRNLAKLGLAGDVIVAARLDEVEGVPIYSTALRAFSLAPHEEGPAVRTE